ncbi:MAG: hypothetical protein A2Y93_03320 [Chloroflexi bacterium RBG_13_68_17]|jgi:hypothetical protein|nr:MAG: hypothetical protein A2Y93_03320 [Chloroflexi bacterium RBG_13_68_17]
MAVPVLFESAHLMLQELPPGPQPALGDQQVEMALASLTPPVQRLRLAAFGGPWILEPAEPARRPGGFKGADRHTQRTLHCPYCRSMTYQVSVSARPSGLVAVGVCSLCGTRGESFRPVLPR